MSVALSIAALMLTPGSPAANAPAPGAIASDALQTAVPPQEPVREPADKPAPHQAEPADIVVNARRNVPGDPFVALNAKSFELTQKFDTAVVEPVSMGFDSVVPEPMRDGLGNFIKNLREPAVFINFVLQHKIGKATETVGRFVINSTVGVAGLFDIARRKPFHLPRRPNGFADTFGFYGVGTGPFFFLPIAGPTTLRDLIGGTLDRLILPTIVGSPFTSPYYNIGTGTGVTLDRRVKFDDQLKAFRATSDPYSARRDFYLNGRKAEIDHLRGKDTPAAGGVKPY
ncbi:VacJ family lipoprotein [Sphingomonas sp. H39-1-10]|uniref:MlaA family lipoprotein n=1 Tax=Sphingomonas TaxID=13687 RepID=UPI00088FED10|nr:MULTISPECIES: VacJ family lipoprotein [Sphingomonas]MDF0486549.1 VacJ family lipoprotein [Sphingomonas pollutisoli]SDA22620.1 phospholipid-binding lipoprotein MlaA [Sphingomonas sp. NFR15]